MIRLKSVLYIQNPGSVLRRIRRRFDASKVYTTKEVPFLLWLLDTGVGLYPPHWTGSRELVTDRISANQYQLWCDCLWHHFRHEFIQEAINLPYDNSEGEMNINRRRYIWQ